MMLATLRLMRPAWRRLLGATGLATLATASAVTLLAVSAWLITRAAFMPPVLTLMVAIVAVRALGIGRAVFRYAERLVAHDAALRALIEVRVRLYRVLEALAPATFWRKGDLLQRLSADVDVLADLLIRGLLPAASSGIVLIAGVAALLFLLPSAALVLAVGLLVAVAVAAGLSVSGARSEAELDLLRAKRQVVVTETLLSSSDPALLLNSSWRHQLAQLDDREERLAARLGRGSGAAAGVAMAAMAAAVGLNWWLAAHAAVSGEAVAVVVLLPLALTEVLTAFPAALAQIQRGRLAAARLFEVLDTPLAADGAGVDQGRLEPPISIALRDLTVRWPGMDRPAVTGLDLDLSPGRRVALVGRSGSGKSSVLAALLGFVAPASGRLELNGTDYAHLAGERVRHTVSLCDQQAYLFDSSILENVRLARAGATDAEVRAAVDAALLGDWVDSLPDGVNTRVGHLGTLVSGGQRQRIAFARALLANRPVLLLDEPTAGLDGSTGRALISDMLDAATGVTIVLVTHEVTQLTGFDEIVVLDEGLVIRRGSYLQLFGELNSIEPEIGEDCSR